MNNIKEVSIFLIVKENLFANLDRKEKGRGRHRPKWVASAHRPQRSLVASILYNTLICTALERMRFPWSSSMSQRKV